MENKERKSAAEIADESIARCIQEGILAPFFEDEGNKYRETLIANIIQRQRTEENKEDTQREDGWEGKGA